MERLFELIASQLGIESARVWPSLVYTTWINAVTWLSILNIIEIMWSTLGILFYRLLQKEHNAKYPDGKPIRDTFGSLDDYESDLADKRIWTWCTLAIWFIGTTILLLCVPNLVTRISGPEAMTIMDIMSKK